MIPDDVTSVDDLSALADVAVAFAGLPEHLREVLLRELVGMSPYEQRLVALRFVLAAAVTRWAMALGEISDVVYDVLVRVAQRIQEAGAADEVFGAIRELEAALGDSGERDRRAEALAVLTERQREVYDAIVDWAARHGGQTPTFVLLGQVLGIAPQTARAHVMVLESKLPWVEYDRDLRRIVVRGV